MSYCRFAWGGSDVYVYEGSTGITCCGCSLGGCDTEEPEEMIAHLAQHRRAGHVVPEHAITALWNDIPGKGSGPEPVGLTVATLQLDLAVIQLELDKLKAAAWEARP